MCIRWTKSGEGLRKVCNNFSQLETLVLEAAEDCVCAQSCLTICDPMDYSLPGSSAHGIFQAILDWVAISEGRNFMMKKI